MLIYRLIWINFSIIIYGRVKQYGSLEMQIHRTRSRKNDVFELKLEVTFDDYELKAIKSANLMNIRIQTYDGSLLGKDATLLKTLTAFRIQLGRIKRRWSVALIRTTGSVFVDIIYNFCDIFAQLFVFLFRMFFGRRKRIRDLMKGIRIRSRRVEKLKETEFFVFASLAALQQALSYAGSKSGHEILTVEDLAKENTGLDFAGVATDGGAEGSDLAGEILKGLMDQMSSN